MYKALAIEPEVPPALLIQTTLAKFEFSTGQLPRGEQFSAWQEMVSPLADLFPSETARTGYEAKQTSWDLGRAALMRSNMPATTFERTPRHLRSYSIDHWCFVCARSGTAEVVGAQRTCVTMPGTAKIISLRGMFQGSITPMNALCVFVPRDLCRDVAGALDAADNTNLTSGLGRLLADYLLDLDRRMSMITTSEVPNILAATSAMITACVSPSADRLAEAQTPIDMTLLERARNLIQHNLFSPNFGAEELCHSLGVSRSRLYRLFEPLGGVVTYIRTQRLLDAHAALSDSEDLRPIIEIAAERGFVDPAEFSRAFRREFGYRPKDARGLAFGWPMRRELNAEPKDGRQRLGDILRRLQ